MNISNLIRVPCKGFELILLPASSISLFNTQLSVSNQQDLEAALPYALEEQLVQNVDDLHFAWTRTAKDSLIHVVVVSHAIMQSLQSEFTEPNTLVLPDVLTLPIASQRWCVVVDGDRALVRTGVYEGFECHRDMLAQQIKLFLRDHPIPKKILYRYQQQDAEDCLPEVIRTITHYAPFQSFKSWIRHNAVLAPGLNLYSGAYRIRRKRSWQLNHWLPAAALVLITLLFHFGYSWYQILRYEHLQADLTEQSHALFKEAFPHVKRIIRPKFQAEQELQRLGVKQKSNSNQFFNVYGHTLNLMNTYPDLKMLSFSWQNNRFDYQLEASNMTSIESFNRKLLQLGLKSEVFNFVNDKGKAKSRLRIQAE